MALIKVACALTQGKSTACWRRTTAYIAPLSPAPRSQLTLFVNERRSAAASPDARWKLRRSPILVPRRYILPQYIVPTTVKDILCLGHILCRVIFVPTIGQDNLCQGHIFCRNVFVPTTGEDNLCLNVPYIYDISCLQQVMIDKLLEWS